MLSGLRVILDDAEQLVGRGREAYDEDALLRLAGERIVERAGIIMIEVVGIDGIRERHPYVDWKGVIGMRQVLVHDYDVVDPEVVWDAMAGSGFATLRRLLSTEESGLSIRKLDVRALPAGRHKGAAKSKSGQRPL